MNLFPSLLTSAALRRVYMPDMVIVAGGDPAAEEPSEDEASPEVIADAAVEIAEIEADRDITLAAIAADTEIERATALGRNRIVELEAELGTCRTKISILEEALATSEAARLTPPALAAPPAPLNPEPDPSPAESIPPEVLDPVVSAELPAEPPRRRQKLRWI